MLERFRKVIEENDNKWGRIFDIYVHRNWGYRSSNWPTCFCLGKSARFRIQAEIAQNPCLYLVYNPPICLANFFGYESKIVVIL